MPIFHISEEQPIFPDPSLADDQGLLGIGGNLDPETLIMAYSEGIFPWYNEHDPILWWSPNPRFVLFPGDLKVSKSMRPYFNQKKFDLTLDTHFKDVIIACSRIPRAGQGGTWITNEMIDAYCRLHEAGFAHSVEVWSDGKLAGGLYGVSLGRMFFGESMFTLIPNASKFGFISLVKILQSKGFNLIDCQQETKHLERLGAKKLKRNVFLELLSENYKLENLKGKWTSWL
ncbi:leucyl/phenylalanyl-tRNA--protein transferase [Portibacter lacus]|uniref:Leucyl/phenylalanyl-tRNA--protein transferase n=1 Tax=Portibacter lacus TaxID=1099794 RepID=A0AA37WF95_9BACT|nr:leucyl/phenylalanyl-tRNA--protein transferase [Portibacter lacus]GLR16770.1 leucyl/phenylalanyl-tRNA--protein transferase [Portibacter lacus]